MILFEKDYALMSKDHIDIETSNKSFIRTHVVLKKMGIKNNLFFMILLDTDLKGIDPYDLKDDSVELKLRIVRECKLNPWYFFRVMLRIPAAGTSGVQYQLSRANLGMIWLYFNHVDNLLIMPRQIGKTMGSLGITAAVIYLLGQNINFSMLTKDTKLRKENVARLKDIRDTFPDWFIYKQRSDIDNSETISYEAFNNKYITYVGQQSVSGAERLGRGMTTPSQHWDEVAFFPNIEITYPIAISTTNAAVESAKAHGQPYGNILTTTAGMLNTKEGRFTHKLICNSLSFTEQLYDLRDEEELHKVVRANSPQCMVYSEFSHLQLGKTQEWFEEKAARTAGDDDVIARDYLNQWTFGSSKSPIDKRLLEKLYNSKQDPAYVEYIDEFMIRWYLDKSVINNPPVFEKIPIVAGMDASENVGRDFTSFVFVDARDFSVVATCSCNTSNIIKVAMFVCKWLVKKNFLFIPERNSVGVAIIDYCLLRLEQLGVNPFYRIYNNVINEFKSGWTSATVAGNVTKAELSRPGAYESYRKEFGFRTSGASRPLLYKAVFTRAVEVAGDLVHDSSLINQMTGLTIKNGRVDHGNDGNDDSVIAYLLTGHALFFGNNLDMYDFCNGNADILLSELPSLTDEVKKNNIDIANVEQLKDDIVRLEKSAKTMTNSTLKIEALQKIRILKEKLPKDEGTILTTAHSANQLKTKKRVLTGNHTDNSRSIYNYLSSL